MAIQAEGAEHANLADAAKHKCPTCNGTTFQVEATMSNGGGEGAEGLYLLCQCGQIAVRTFTAFGATGNYSD